MVRIEQKTSHTNPKTLIPKPLSHVPKMSRTLQFDITYFLSFCGMTGDIPEEIGFSTLISCAIFTQRGKKSKACIIKPSN